MKTKWNELSSSEKIQYMISIIFCIIAVVFAVIDFCTEWKYADLGWSVAFGLYLANEAKMSWNKNRKSAIIELVCAILLIAFNIVTMIL